MVWSAGIAVGYVVTYFVDPSSGWATLGAYLHGDSRQGTMPEAILQGGLKDCQMAFRVRKVYIEIFEFDSYLKEAADSLGLSQEGRLKTHWWYNDRYWDLFHYSYSALAPENTDSLHATVDAS